MPPKGDILKSHRLAVRQNFIPVRTVTLSYIERFWNVYNIKTIVRVQEPRLYLRGQGHTIVLKFHIIAIRVKWYTHFCPDCNFVMPQMIKNRHTCLPHQDNVLRRRITSLLQRSSHTNILKFNIYWSQLEIIGTHNPVRNFVMYHRILE
jgi:hypothetical protein